MNEWSNEQLEEMFGDDIIEKLAFLAGCKTHRAVNFENIPDGYIVTDEAFTKFAELIVEECVAQCWTVSELEHKGYVISECSKRMRKHFGVEE